MKLSEYILHIENNKINDKKIISDLTIDPNFKSILTEVSDRGDASSLLEVAAQEGRPMLVKFLLEQGADVNQRNPITKLTPLLSLLKSEYEKNKIVKYLEIVAIFDEYDVDFSAQEIGAHSNKRNALHLAIDFNWSYEMISTFTHCGVPLDQENHEAKTPSAVALGKGKDDVVKLLKDKLESNLSNKRRRTERLDEAQDQQFLNSIWGNHPIFQTVTTTLTQHNDDAPVIPSVSQQRDETPSLTLHERLRVANVDVNALRIYLQNDRSAKINEKNRLSMTPLHVLLKNNSIEHTELLAVLLESGANIDISDANKITPLHMIVNNEALIQKLKLSDNQTLRTLGAKAEALLPPKTTSTNITSVSLLSQSGLSSSPAEKIAKGILDSMNKLNETMFKIFLAKVTATNVDEIQSFITELNNDNNFYQKFLAKCHSFKPDIATSHKFGGTK